MSVGFKVKLEDGSIVGPLDLEMLGSWLQQGLINPNSPVLATNARRWARLREVVDLGEAAPRARPAGGNERASRAVEVDEVEAEDSEPRYVDSRHGRVLAGGVLIAAAATAAASLLMPRLWRPELSSAPWQEMGYVLVLLALTALHEAEWTRRFARVGVCLAAFAVFPVTGMLLAQGVPLEALAVLGFAWLLATGLFYLLAPAMGWPQLAASTGAVLVGVYGIVHFGVMTAVSGSHMAMM
jgi:hypothetical protein